MRLRCLFVLLLLITFLLCSYVSIYASANEPDTEPEQVQVQEQVQSKTFVDCTAGVRDGASRSDVSAPAQDSTQAQEIEQAQDSTQTQETAQAQDSAQTQETAQAQTKTQVQDASQPQIKTQIQEPIQERAAAQTPAATQTQEPTQTPTATQLQEPIQASAATQPQEPTHGHTATQAPGQSFDLSLDKDSLSNSSQTGNDRIALSGDGNDVSEKYGNEDQAVGDSRQITNRTKIDHESDPFLSNDINQYENSEIQTDEARLYSANGASIVISPETADSIDGFQYAQSPYAHNSLPEDTISENNTPGNAITGQIFKDNRQISGYAQSAPAPLLDTGIAASVMMGVTAVLFFALIWVKTHVRANT